MFPLIYFSIPMNSRTAYCLWVLIFSFLYTGFVSAQEPFFRKYELPASLSGKEINSVCQDLNGLIWLASSNGVYSFNGVAFESVDLPSGLKSTDFTSIASSAGKVAAGTALGEIVIFDRDSSKLFYSVSGEDPPIISSVIYDNKDRLWFSTLGSGVFCEEKDRVRQFTTGNGLGDDFVYTLFLDGDGTIWAGSDGGLSYQFSSGKFRNLGTSDGLPESIVRNITSGPDKSLLIGMEDLGVCMFLPDSGKFILFEEIGWNDGPVTSLLMSDQEVWAGTRKAGIVSFRFNETSHTHLNPLLWSLDEADINCMIRDRDQNIWIAAGGFLYWSPGSKISIVKSISSFTPVEVRAVLHDSKGVTWLSDKNAFYQIEDDDGFIKKAVMPFAGTPVSSYQIISIYEDTLGYIWLGCFDYGVIRMDPKNNQWIRLSEKDGLINGSVLSITQSGSSVWFATLGGASKLRITGSGIRDLDPFISYAGQLELGTNFIYTVFNDSRNRVWFGTDGRGVSFYDGKNFNTISDLKNKVIYSIAEDPDGNLWFSSADEGLFRFDGKKVMNFGVAEGLSSLEIASVAFDRYGNLLAFHPNGYDILDSKTFQVLNYGPESGLTKVSPELNAVHVGSDGLIRAGMDKGFIKIKTEHPVAADAPRAVIRNVLSFLVPVSPGEATVFPYDKNHISFSILALWYPDPSRITYQYRLKGYSESWIETRDRLITFPNLPPGKYEFFVRASLTSNFDSAEIVSFRFTVTPPFWTTGWFMAVVLFLTAALLYVFLHYRDKRIQKIETMKRQQILTQFEVLRNQVNPHFLFNSFNTLINVIEDDRELAVEYVNKLSDFFRSVLTYRDRNLISLHDEIELAESYSFLQQKRYPGSFRIDFDVPPADRRKYFIPPMTLQMLIENCLKHNAVSKDTPLSCKISLLPDNRIEVSNNINVKKQPETGTSVGLSNIRTRYSIITDRPVEITDDGMVFKVILPLLNHD